MFLNHRTHYSPPPTHRHAYQLQLLIRCSTPGPGLPKRVERCVVAHEIVHAEYGDQPTTDRHWHARREARCNRIAADRLINEEELIAAMRATQDPRQVALDLNVTSWFLEAYLNNHPDLTFNPSL